MKLRDLEYLVTLAAPRHFGRAAAANVSQPALSRQVRKLEDALGVALFERDSRNVAVTAAGAAIVAEARQALAHAAAIDDIAKAFRDPLAGSFKLGIIASLGPFLAPDLLAQLRHDAPRLSVILQERLTDELLAALRDRELDAAIVATPAGGDLQEMPLFDEPFLLAHAPDQGVATKRAPRLSDLGHGTLLLLEEGHCLRDQALSLCRAETVDASVKATSLITLMGVAAQGRGATLVPALAARFAQGLTLRRLANREAQRRIRLVARRNFPRSGALEVIAAAARAVAAAAGLSSGSIPRASSKKLSAGAASDKARGAGRSSSSLPS